MAVTAASPTGYSGTPLAKKLGIEAGHTLVAFEAPDELSDLLAPLPKDAVILDRPTTGPDIVLFFTDARDRLESRIDELARAIHPDAALWVCWPKRASKVPTDVTEDVVRETALPRGLVDVKVAAIDAMWSGLKLVWRTERC